MIDRMFNDDAVVLYTCTDDNYVPYLLVLLTSIISNTSQKTNYDIIVFELTLNVENRKKIEKLAEGHNNISVRVFNIQSHLQFDYRMWRVGKWTPEIYITILAMYVLTNYDKAIYMDCDVICLRDLRELYQIDVNGALIGAVKLLPRYILKSNIFFHSLNAQNWRGIFDLKYDYFNNGVMIQNIKAFREMYSLEYIFDYISTQTYLLPDQDTINHLTRNHVVWIDSAWNIYPYTKEQFSNMITLVPEDEKEYWVKGYENWGCIHYTIPVKPWLETKGCYSYAGKFFWQYAAQLGKKEFSFFADKAFRYDENKRFLADVIKYDYVDLQRALDKKKLLVYGYGFRGKQVYLNSQLDITGFIDMDEKKRIGGASVSIGGLEMIDDPEKYVILISNDSWETIALELKERGIKDVFSLACLEKRDLISWYPEKEDYFSISLCFGLLNDKRSKFVFDSIILKRNNRVMDRTIKYSDIYESGQYFNKDIFTITPEEVYVDVGSYNGITIDGFICYTQSKYKKIYGFELNKLNYELLCENIEGENIILKNIAVSNYIGTGKYNNNGYCSGLTEQGRESVQTDLLDNLVNEKVTFVKINVYNTGDVVRGAKGILTNHKPKLAIVLSNKYSDLWEIPLLIHEINPEYSLYIRHHSIDFSSTVLYAV